MYFPLPPRWGYDVAIASYVPYCPMSYGEGNSAAVLVVILK